jgi:Xaa-Pro aminopeptidase
VISELKLVKDEWEIAQLQEAIDATVRGFEDVARCCRRPRRQGAPARGRLRAARPVDGNDVGYSSIVGAGAHATILHWVRNTGMTAPGELLLMDMGVEGNNFYTPTSPARSGVRHVHPAAEAGVRHRARLAAGRMDFIKPGVVFQDVHKVCMRVLAEGLKIWGCCR